MIINVYDYLKKAMHNAILLYVKGINMQKKENVNIQFITITSWFFWKESSELFIKVL